MSEWKELTYLRLCRCLPDSGGGLVSRINGFETLSQAGLHEFQHIGIQEYQRRRNLSMVKNIDLF